MKVEGAFESTLAQKAMMIPAVRIGREAKTGKAMPIYAQRRKMTIVLEKERNNSIYTKYNPQHHEVV